MMTGRTKRVLGALVASFGAATAGEVAALLELPDARAVVASLVSLSSQGLVVRLAGAKRRYEATDVGRQEWQRMEQESKPPQGELPCI
jgi:sugar-specific transcriptional regulator TrmB